MSEPKTPIPTRADLDELLAKYSAAEASEMSWGPAHVEYPQEVKDLIGYLETEPWVNHAYPAARMRAIFDQVKSADMLDVRSMLTSFMRGERFCMGHWKGYIESGKLRAVIERAKAIIEADK